jgi:hypothetical protein
MIVTRSDTGLLARLSGQQGRWSAAMELETSGSDVCPLITPASLLVIQAHPPVAFTGCIRRTHRASPLFGGQAFG